MSPKKSTKSASSKSTQATTKRVTKTKKKKIIVRNVSVLKPFVDKKLSNSEPEFFGKLPDLDRKEVDIKEQDIKAKKKLTLNKMKTTKSSKLYRNISLSFIFATIILLGLILYFTFVNLTITIIPTEERLVDNMVINIENNPAQASSIKGVVEQIELSEEKSYSSSGLEKIGEEVTGKVTIVNEYGKNQPLVATTRLLSADGKLFRIKNTVNVPAGGLIEVDVYADESSAEMAIGPSKFTIPGLWAGLQNKIYGQSKTAFAYQQQTKNHIVQIDIDQGVADMKKTLIEKAKKKLGESYKGYNEVLYKIDEGSVSTEVDGKIGEEKAEFSISMKTNVVVVAFSKEDVGKIANEKLAVVVPDNKKIISFDQDAIEYDLQNYNVDQGTASVQIKFSGTMSATDGLQLIDKNKIVGLTKQQLDDYLPSFSEISGYDIKFSPAFIDKVPKMLDRINIEIK